MDLAFLCDLIRLTSSIHSHIHRTWGAESLLTGSVDVTFQADECTIEGELVTSLTREVVAVVPIVLVNYATRSIEPISRTGEILPPLRQRLGDFLTLEEILPCP